MTVPTRSARRHRSWRSMVSGFVAAVIATAGLVVVAAPAQAGMPSQYSQTPSGVLMPNTEQTVTFRCADTEGGLALTHGLWGDTSGIGGDETRIAPTSTGDGYAEFSFVYQSASSRQLEAGCEYGGSSYTDGATLRYTVYEPTSAPRNLQLTPHNGSWSASWVGPASAGNGTIDGYAVRWRTVGASTWTSSTLPPGTSVMVFSQVNGRTYEVQVAASNELGVGTWSEMRTVTPRTVPDAPGGLTATAADEQVAVGWTVPASDGGSAITGYLLEWSADGGQTWTSRQAAGTTDTVTGLVNGTQYQFRVRAENAAGPSAPSGLASATPVGAPRAGGLIATPQDGGVRFSVTAPSENGGSALRQWDISVSNGVGIIGSVGSPGHDLTGLDNGVTYQATLTWTNDVGTGPGTTVSFTPTPPPAAPTSVDITDQDGRLFVTWSPAHAPYSPDTGYRIEASSNGGLTWDAITPMEVDGVGAIVTGLTNGTEYTVRVAARNTAGLGGWQQQTGTPRGVPEAPVLTLTPQNAQILATWSEPSNGGAAITGYQARFSSDNGATWVTLTPRPDREVTYVGLPNGREYLAQVRAINVAGEGPWSTVRAATPRAVPGRPVLDSTVGDGRIDLTWTAPADNGAAITGYSLHYSVDGGHSWVDESTTATSATLTGLSNGTEYRVRVAALNDAGVGLWAETTLTPHTVPAAVTGLTAIPGDSSIALTWAAADDGGLPLTGYRVQTSTDGVSWADRTASGTSTTLSGLTNGTAYRVRVAAQTAAGLGPWTQIDSTPFTFTPEVLRGSGATISAGSVLNPGEPLTVRLGDLPVGATVVMEFHSVVTVLDQGVVGADGSIVLRGSIPADAAAGAHHVVLRLTDAGTDIAPVRIPVRVAAALGATPVAPVAPTAPTAPVALPVVAPVAAPAVPSGTALAVTGGGVDGPVGLALALLIAGAGAVTLAGVRRRLR